MPLHSIVQFVTVFILFILVIAMAYFVSKWLAGYQKLKGMSANVEVLETYRVAPGKFIAIVRIGEKYLALGVGKDEVNVITSLDKEELTIRSPQEAGGASFAELLKKFRVGDHEQG